MAAIDLLPLQLRELILNTRKPLVLRKFETNWKCVQGTVGEWCQKFDAAIGSPVKFERISVSTNEVQWERNRIPIEMTASEFLQEHSVDRDYWTAMNYKRSNELPRVCTEGVDFNCFGFPHASDDCSYWFSSKGANTPCHYDTYGCNIVIQLYGRKSWLLFPPDSPLTSSRIPYEESSVYCLENFYAPNLRDLAHFKKLQDFAYRCILEPQDVLIVPRHWWHYAEALEISLSVNHWIPLRVDKDAQIEECIVKYLMETFVNGTNTDTIKYVLNPNQLQEVSQESELLDILEYLLTSVDEIGAESSKKVNTIYDYQYLDDEESILETLSSNVNKVPQMTNTKFIDFLTQNAERFNSECSDNSEKGPLKNIKMILMNSICNRETITMIKNELYRRFSKAKENR